MINRVITDRDDRRGAVLTPHHAFVWASAGTGKTHTLTLRALFLLLHAKEDALYMSDRREERLSAARRVLQSIALTTFTRKASAEMKTRLYGYLNAIVSSANSEELSGTEQAHQDPLFVEIVESAVEKSPPRDYECFRLGVEALAERASELQISTIHSFAASILRRHPLEAGIPPGARFAREEEDEDEVQSVTGQLIQRWWEVRAGRDSELQHRLSRVLELVPVAQIRKWFREIHSHPWVIEELSSFTAANISAGEFQQALNAMIEQLRSSRFSKVSRCRRQLEVALDCIKQKDSEGWRILCNFAGEYGDYFFHSSKKSPQVLKEAITSLPGSLRQYFEDHESFYRHTVQMYLKEAEAERWTSWCHLMDDFARWSETASMKELGLVTFDDMIRLATQLLRECPEVKVSERLRLRAILVDEFQDTDPRQFDLLENLLGTSPNDKSDVLGFFVGDPKQSIYRFRGVDVTSIADFRREYDRRIKPRFPIREFQLSTSFRSVPAVTTFVNSFFSENINFASEEEYLRPYRTEQSLTPRWVVLTGPNQELLTAEKARRMMAEATVQLILEHVENHGSFSDVLVLVRKAAELDILLPTLYKANIPVIATGARTFYRHHEVLDALNLLIALHHPDDTVAVAGILRSPMILASDDDIYRLFRIVPPSRLLSEREDLPGFLSPEMAGCISRLRTLFHLRTTLPLRDWLREVRAFVPVHFYVAHDDPEGRSLARIQRTFESFRQVSEEGIFPPISWLVRQRNRAAEGDRREGNLGEDVSLADETVDAVRAMTIHKAKGLEAPFVIGYGWMAVVDEILGRNQPPAGNVIHTRNPNGDLVRGFSLDWGPVTLTSTGYQQAKDEEKWGSCKEGERLAYVTATRSRDQLILLSPHRKEIEGHQLGELNMKCLEGLAEKWVELKLWCPRRTPPRIAQENPFVLKSEAYQRFWEKRQRQLETWGSPLLLRPSGGDLPHSETSDFPAGGESSLLTGRLVHSYLERWVADPRFSQEKFRLIRQEIAAIGEVLDSGSLKRARAILCRFYGGELRDHQLRSYRDRVQSSRITGRELPVYIAIDGKRWNGILDLVMEEEDRLIAVDYKTSAPLNPLPESYKRQKEIYHRALQELFPGRTIIFEFWWLGGKREAVRPSQKMLPFAPGPIGRLTPQ